MKKIIHIDMDYFYAQVEELDRPELKGRPVAIGGLMGGRGVLCTSNYEARKYGVFSAMSTVMALKKCPNLILLRPNMHKYKEVSEQVFAIFSSYTDQVQKLSLDEAYLDVTECRKCNNDALSIAKEIKEKIFKQTGLTASAGVSYNKLLAKIGSDLFKPNGLAVLRPEGIEKKIAYFSIKKIWGVGKVTQAKMNSLNIYTFGDLQKFSKLDLINYFGEFGSRLFYFCRGIDDRKVISAFERKSVSTETTFVEDKTTLEELDTFLVDIFDELQRRLKKYSERKIKSIFVKIKYHDFSQTTIESQESFCFKNYQKLLHKRFSEKKLPVRLLGVGVRFYSLSQEETYQQSFSL